MIYALILVGLWLLISMKTSRSDGDLVRGVHPYRRLMAFIMRTRTESVVYSDTAVRAEKLMAFLEAHAAEGITLTHVLLAATATALEANPRLNRFVVGKRLYQRRGRFVTFSMKRKKLDAKAKIAVVKLELLTGESLADCAKRIDGVIDEQRSGERTYADKEYGLFNALPRPILTGATACIRWLDANNVLPAFFIRDDGLYTSVFIANLGSLAMSAPYHHLYEWGNCPLFMGVGAIEDRVVVEDGQVVAAKVLPIRWSFDERVEDGLSARGGIDALTRLLEDPEILMSLPSVDAAQD
jgi:hypothetical protein